ncbi:hypothetical protein [Cognatishimia sp.]|uniref:hypothetical protein n=1 Tax=Cognatishimia sp. TaxID=2211648 RepID=UPI003511B507
MQVALHFGAPYTDENRLQMCLGKNRELLAGMDTIVPRPAQFRKQLRPLMSEVLNASNPLPLQQDFMQSITGGTRPNRVIFSADNFLGFPRTSISENEFFPGPFNRLVSFLRLFEDAEVEFFYAIRNPATFMQALMVAHNGDDFSALTGHSDPMALRWSSYFERVIEDCPNTQITVWCNEDTPLIWEEILREVAGVDPTIPLNAQYDLLKDILTQEGFERFEEYLKARPDLTQVQKRRVIAAFLEKFADEDALEEELEVPGWTDEVVDAMTEIYDDDVYLIQSMPEINFLEP